MTDKSASERAITDHIDAVCDNFESIWQAGESARTEDYIAQIEDGPERETLIVELLLLEFHYRRRRGDPVTLDELFERFPDRRPLMEELSAEHLDRLNKPVKLAGGTPSDPLGDPLKATWPQADSSAIEPAGPGDDKQTLPSRKGLVGERTVSAAHEEIELPVPKGYVLCGKLGQGGMGVVVKARQIGPDRTVALKFVRPDGFKLLNREGQRQLVERFRAEIRAIAKIEHENIVRIYEIGEVEGLPFFSMQYVDGVCLTSVAQRPSFGNREAATLLEPIARALHAVHRGGTLHRDVKPQNILIENQTNRPLLVDFGLAKLIDVDFSMTSDGDLMGSPPYASPEQLRSPGTVDQRADVYSFGATLYHTLTGRPPFQAHSLSEILRQVTDDEPLAPRRLNPSIARDLETICLKCLQKDARKRYTTMDEVADDLRRYLNDEPILARPIGLVERLFRWCKRKPAIAGLSIAVVVLLMAVALVSTIGFVRVLDARRSEHQQRLKAEQGERDAKANLQLARNVVDTFLTQVSDDPRLKSRGVETLRHELLEMSRKFYDVFVQKKGEDLAVRFERACAYARLAALTAKLGSSESAISLYQEALHIVDGIPDTYPEINRLHRYQADWLNSLGMLFRDTGRHQDARRMLQEAFHIHTVLVKVEPDSRKNRSGLANSHFRLGIICLDERDFSKASTHLETAIEIYSTLLSASDNPNYRAKLAQCQNNMAIVCRNMGDVQEAETHYLAALELWKCLVDQQPVNPDFQTNLARCHHNIGVLYRELGRLDDARKNYTTALAIHQTLTREHPAIPEYQSEVAASQNNLGPIYEEMGQFDQAESAYRDAASCYQRLVDLHPNVPEYARNHAISQYNLGSLLIKQNRLEDAEHSLREAATELNKLAESHTGVALYLEHLAVVYENLALLYRQSKRTTDAETAIANVNRARRTLLQQFPSPTKYKVAYAAALGRSFGFHWSSHQQARALKDLELLTTFMDTIAQEPDAKALVLIPVFLEAGECYLQASQAEQAIGLFDRILGLLQTNTDFPERDILRTELLARRGEAHELAGNFDAAVADWRQLLQLIKQPTDRARGNLHLASCLARAGHYTDAVNQVEQIAGQINNDPVLLFMAAQVFAVSASRCEQDLQLSEAKRSELAQHYRKEAVNTLRRCATLDFFQTPERRQLIERDEDLARLYAKGSADQFVRQLTHPDDGD